MRSTARSLFLSAALAGLVALPSAPSSAQEDPFATFAHSENMIPLGASLRPNPASGIYNSDLAFWGNRAYEGTYDGFRIIDITDPANPQSLNDYTGCSGASSSNQGDLIVWNNILVRAWNSPTTVNANNTPPLVTCDGVPVHPSFEGLHIFDISNPADPALLGSVQLPCGSHTATGVPDPGNNRLLVYNGGSSGTPCSWIEIVEIPLAAPASARLLGLAPTGRSCHDNSVILGSAMYAVCAGGNGFTVFSIGGARGGTLTNPVELYRKTVAGVTIGHSASFSWDGEVLIFGHEPGGGSQAQCLATSGINKTVFFYKAVDGTALGTWVLPRPQTTSENCTIHNFNVVPTTNGRRILVSGNYQSGIAVVDFTDPANAVEIAYADPAPLKPTRLGGDWSSYWYDGHIYESDITRGLLVWELDDEAVAGATVLGRLNPQTMESTFS